MILCQKCLGVYTNMASCPKCGTGVAEKYDGKYAKTFAVDNFYHNKSSTGISVYYNGTLVSGSTNKSSDSFVNGIIAGNGSKDVYQKLLTL